MTRRAVLLHHEALVLLFHRLRGRLFVPACQEVDEPLPVELVDVVGPFAVLPVHRDALLVTMQDDVHGSRRQVAHLLVRVIPAVAERLHDEVLAERRRGKEAGDLDGSLRQ